MMGGGQAQFYELLKNGINFVSDPKQMVFTNDERLTVQGVLDGDFEVGFARTDQIERHLGKDGQPLPRGTFKVINPHTHVLDDGSIFPFLSSTTLHPEWPVSALAHVSNDVAKEVQEALLALRDHAAAVEVGKPMRCDTTPEVSELALDASKTGNIAGFRTARSYFGVRTKQETASLLRLNDEGVLHCIRGETLYADVECPKNYYKLPKSEFRRSCERMGLDCLPGFQCYCKPCIIAFEVAVSQYLSDDLGNTTYNSEGCAKMSLCGVIEQHETATFRAFDNLKRLDPDVRAFLHLDYETIELSPLPVPDEAWTYELRWNVATAGAGVIEIYFDGIQIPESPIRVRVDVRNCETDFPGETRVPDVVGNCVCDSDTADVGGTCIQRTVFAIAGSICGVIFVSIVGICLYQRKNRKNDEVWKVNVNELHFNDPVEVIGQGSFGVVLLAEYRGTKVAIKRALKRAGHRGSLKGSASSVAGNGGSMKRSVGEPSNLVEDMESPGDPNDGVYGSVNPSSMDLDLDFLSNNSGRHQRTWWARLFPWARRESHQERFKTSILQSAGASMSGGSSSTRIFPCCSESMRRKQDFVSEMRVLSRLRHPCITTVMGAVVNMSDPMLVLEYMEYGSVYDLLQNETMYLTGEIIMQIMRDLAQGLRYLHSSRPPILHGDLKSRNLLVDNRFRAKICDFGLSTKQQGSISGSPYFMAPEYLRREKDYDPSCDMYSVGILMYEIFARKSPYEGEDFRKVLQGVCNRRKNK